jgi:ribose transport system substrate-binding protein
MKRTILTGVLGATLLLAAGCSTGANSNAAGGTSSPSTSSGGSVIDLDITGTTGPNGEKPTPLDQLTFTDEELAKLKAGNFTAAQVWHTSGPFISAVQGGAKDEFDRLGIKVTTSTNANMNAGTQSNQVQTAMATKPSVMIGLPVDPTSAAAAFKPAVDAGTKLVFLSNVPDGYTYGKEYSSIVTDDLFAMGEQAAQALGKALGGKGKVAILFYDAKYYVTNQRDSAFKTTLEKEFPDIEIVAEKGFTDPNNATSIASALLTQHPDLAGIYTSWAQPANGVLSALRTVNNTKVKIATLDIEDPIMVDMAGGGATVAVVADEAYNLGKGMADAAAYALLGKQAPPFVVAPAFTITEENIAEGYERSLNAEVPGSVQQALDHKG